MKSSRDSARWILKTMEMPTRKFSRNKTLRTLTSPEKLMASASLLLRTMLKRLIWSISNLKSKKKKKRNSNSSRNENSKK